MGKNNRIIGIVFIAILLAIILTILSNFMLYERRIKIVEVTELMKEELRPAELEVIKLTADDCDSCFSIKNAIEELKRLNVNITKEESFASNSIKGKELIAKYGIKRLPTILVSGEINKTEQLASYFEEKGGIKDNLFVYTSLNPPYFDVQLDRIIGIVSITLVVDSSCEKCLDSTEISSLFKKQGVSIQNEKFVEYNSKEGQDLIKQFEIRQIPAFLISKEIDYYSNMKEALSQSGAEEKDGFYAVHSTLPPYRDLSKNEIVGLVDVIYLTNSVCPACYDVSINKNILARFGLVLDNENTYDLNSLEGKQIIQKYKISKLPIIILSPDAEYYYSFVQAWKDVGTIEDDGWFVMRNPEAIGPHWDLEKNKVIDG